MSLFSYIEGKDIKTALHIGAYTGEELSNYTSWGDCFFEKKVV